MSASEYVHNCVTTLDMYTFDFKWTIKSAEEFLASRVNLSSQAFIPDFEVDGNGNKFQWQLHLEYSKPTLPIVHFLKVTINCGSY